MSALSVDLLSESDGAEVDIIDSLAFLRGLGDDDHGLCRETRVLNGLKVYLYYGLAGFDGVADGLKDLEALAGQVDGVYADAGGLYFRREVVYNIIRQLIADTAPAGRRSLRRRSDMNVIEAIKTRRSIRKYKDEVPSKELLQQVIDAAIWTPTAANRQPVIVLAVTNKELRDRLSAMNAAVMGREGDPFYGAPAVLIVLADLQNANRVYDGSLTAGSLMLAAKELGLGTCWIHRAKQMFETEEGKAILKDLGVEGEYEGIANVIIGYADEEPAPKDRKGNFAYFAE